MFFYLHCGRGFSCLYGERTNRCLISLALCDNSNRSGGCCQVLCRPLSVFTEVNIHVICISCRVTYIHIYIVSCNSSREHRALTKFCHLTWLLVSTLTSFHVLPSYLISSKIVRGLPRDLVPWAFHSKAAFAVSPGGRQSVWSSRFSSHLGNVRVPK